MNALSSFFSLPLTWQLSAASVALAVMLASGVGLLAAWLLRRRSAPVRYGLLLSAVVLCLAAPGLSQLGRLSGVGQVRMTLPPAAPTMASEVMSEDTSQTILSEKMPTPPRSSPKPRFVFSWPLAGGVLMAIWALGIIAGLARLALGAGMVWVLIRSSRPADSAASRISAERARQALGLRAPLRLRESPLTPMPLVVGLFRPLILLPSGLADRLDAEQLDAVLLHETAHVAQRDPLIGFAQRLAGALFWWCPLLHLINRRLNELREYICDNYVIRTQGDGFRLARVLVDLAGQAPSGRWLRLAGAMAVAEPGGSRLEARVRRLLRGDCNTVTRMNLAALCATAAFSLLVGCTMMTASIGTDDVGVFTGVKEIRLSRSVPNSPNAETVTIKDPAKISELLTTIKLEKMDPCACDHLESAVFVKEKGEIKVLFCEHCFDFDGKSYEMPSSFYPLFQKEFPPALYLRSPITVEPFADGTIARVWQDKIELNVPKREVREPLRPVINTNTVITIDGKPVQPADLCVGMAVHVVFDGVQSDTAKEIRARSASPAQTQFDPDRAKQATVVLRVRPEGGLGPTTTPATANADKLDLMTVKSLTVAQAEELAESKDMRLDLSGVLSLTPEVAKVLTDFGGQILDLSGLTTLTPEVAAALAKFEGQGKQLYLGGLTTLTPEVAGELSKGDKWTGNLPHLTNLTREVAAELAKYKGDPLQFLGLTTLTPEAAAALAKYKGGINLGNLRVTPEAAEALAKFEAKEIYLSGSLTPQAAAALAKCKAKVILPPNLSL